MLCCYCERFLHTTSQVMAKPQLECSPADGAFRGIFGGCPKPFQKLLHAETMTCVLHDLNVAWNLHLFMAMPSPVVQVFYHQAAWIALLAVCAHVAVHRLKLYHTDKRHTFKNVFFVNDASGTTLTHVTCLVWQLNFRRTAKEVLKRHWVMHKSFFVFVFFATVFTFWDCL